MKLFEVETKCGHVGRRHYLLKSFAIRAENGKEAAMIARNISRVKHNHKDAIKKVIEITPERYYELKAENENDPYFYCENIQDQRMYVSCPIYDEEYEEVKLHEPIKKPVYDGKKLLRNPKKYMKYNYFKEMRYAI